MNISEIFWSASVEDIKNGYVYDASVEVYTCICCGETFEKGRIYQEDNLYFEAKKMVEFHIVKKHQSMFHYLVNMDKKYTNLTENQKQLLEKFYAGESDKDIAQDLKSSPSTVRTQRFQLREKMKQAKVYLSLMELLETKMSNKDSEKLVTIHRTATTIDERYCITEKEKMDILKTYIKEGKLISWPKKQKRIIVILQYIFGFFEQNKIYNEKAVNEIIKETYDDYVTIRRYLIEYGFLERKLDGSEYWVKQ